MFISNYDKILLLYVFFPQLNVEIKGFGTTCENWFFSHPLKWQIKTRPSKFNVIDTFFFSTSKSVKMM